MAGQDWERWTVGNYSGCGKRRRIARIWFVFRNIEGPNTGMVTADNKAGKTRWFSSSRAAQALADELNKKDFGDA